MTPRDLILKTASRFREAGIPDPTEDSALLLSALLEGQAPLSLRVDDHTLLSDDVLDAYEQLVSKRLTREPLQYLLRESVFYGRSFFVDPRVLIPRPETEWLCEWALETLKEFPSPRILDLCTGSGCIGLTLKAERPDASVTMSDLSRDAMAVADRNANRLGLEVLLSQGDLFENLPRTGYHLIISNPPYIPAADCESLQSEVRFEPPLALNGGEDGLDLYRRIIADAIPYLLPGGWLMFELGIHEALPVSSLAEAAGFTDLSVRQDLSGIDRMLRARVPLRRTHV